NGENCTPEEFVREIKSPDRYERKPYIRVLWPVLEKLPWNAETSRHIFACAEVALSHSSNITPIEGDGVNLFACVVILLGGNAIGAHCSRHFGGRISRGHTGGKRTHSN
ncbi:unnamed protein product, partial [Ectocarpus sp. 12 AP-2014]